MAMMEENFERNFANSQIEESEMGFSAFDELDSSIKVLRFKDPSWKNWGGDKAEMQGSSRKPLRAASLLRFGTPGSNNSSHRVLRLNQGKLESWKSRGSISSN